MAGWDVAPPLLVPGSAQNLHYFRTGTGSICSPTSLPNSLCYPYEGEAQLRRAGETGERERERTCEVPFRASRDRGRTISRSGDEASTAATYDCDGSDSDVWTNLLPQVVLTEHEPRMAPLTDE